MPQTSLSKQDVRLGIQLEVDPFLLYRPDQPFHLLRVLELERGLSEPVLGRRERFRVWIRCDIDGLQWRCQIGGIRNRGRRVVTLDYVVQHSRAMRTSNAQGEDREHGVQVRVVSHVDVGGRELRGKLDDLKARCRSRWERQ